MLRCTIYLLQGNKRAQTEFDMSKRLLTSAIVATLMMASTAIYSSAQQDGPMTASIPVLMGG